MLAVSQKEKGKGECNKIYFSYRWLKT